MASCWGVCLRTESGLLQPSPYHFLGVGGEGGGEGEEIVAGMLHAGTRTDTGRCAPFGNQLVGIYFIIIIILFFAP